MHSITFCYYLFSTGKFSRFQTPYTFPCGFPIGVITMRHKRNETKREECARLQAEAVKNYKTEEFLCLLFPNKSIKRIFFISFIYFIAHTRELEKEMHVCVCDTLVVDKVSIVARSFKWLKVYMCDFNRVCFFLWCGTVIDRPLHSASCSRSYNANILWNCLCFSFHISICCPRLILFLLRGDSPSLGRADIHIMYRLLHLNSVFHLILISCHSCIPAMATSYTRNTSAHIICMN